MLTAPVLVRYAVPVTGVPVEPSSLLHPEAINSAPAIAPVMLIALMFAAFTQVSAVDWFELEITRSPVRSMTPMLALSRAAILFLAARALGPVLCNSEATSVLRLL